MAAFEIAVPPRLITLTGDEDCEPGSQIPFARGELRSEIDAWLNEHAPNRWYLMVGKSPSHGSIWRNVKFKVVIEDEKTAVLFKLRWSEEFAE